MRSEALRSSGSFSLSPLCWVVYFMLQLQSSIAGSLLSLATANSLFRLGLLRARQRPIRRSTDGTTVLTFSIGVYRRHPIQPRQEAVHR